MTRLSGELAEWEVIHRCRQLGIEPGTPEYAAVGALMRDRCRRGLTYGHYAMLDALGPAGIGGTA